MLWFSLSTQVDPGIDYIKLLLCFTPSGLYEDIKNGQEESFLDEALTTTPNLSNTFYHFFKFSAFVFCQLAANHYLRYYKTGQNRLN